VIRLLENDLANKRITGSYLEKYIVTYELNNYSAPISFDREISFEEFSTYFLTNYPRFLIELSSQQHSKKSINKSFLSASDKLNYVNTFKSRYCGEHIFDVDKDAFGNTWIATGKNLIRLNGDKFFVQDIPAITLESDDCYLWIGTAAYNSVGSLIKFDGENFIYYNYLNSPLPDNAGILDIKKDNAGNLWIAMKRKGIPGKLENNLVAVFNEAGINLRDVVGLQSSVFVRNYISIGGRKFLTDKLYINYNTDGLRASESLDFYLNDDLIYSAYSDENISENQEFVFEHTLLHQRKYDMKNYLNDSVQNKIELNHFSLDVRFNDLGFFLEQNTPNPFSKHTIIEYGYLQDKYYSVKVFDIFDRFIDESVEASMAIWGQPLIFKAGENPNGIYFYYLVEKNRGVIDAKKMVLFDPEKIITLPH